MKIINGEKHYTAKEVGMLVGRTHLTVHLWDTWSNELFERGDERLIPEPIKIGKQRTRYWNEKDISIIENFAKNIQRGDLAEFSQRQWGKKTDQEHKKNQCSDKKIVKIIEKKKDLSIEERLVYACVFFLEKEAEKVSISQITKYLDIELSVIRQSLQRLVDLRYIVQKEDSYVVIG